eukprot:CAMPEP_0175815468 /NCGR_PEP_ID=MMETSP0107_2-20121207/5978_1 /TAXON_ID=195067 ORGANISM="Goniomonas pacifica, Strain CCMP1869" /NCGR_SAMPLE_ID=MMETSP0107_2 /ASSEMBLY_ACC=CAM_ASM_000203 /LENGTH=44 /DNA_ID= /DNA_START= /DNA_END= /DNA_ORIENTATION=
MDANELALQLQILWRTLRLHESRPKGIERLSGDLCPSRLAGGEA